MKIAWSCTPVSSSLFIVSMKCLASCGVAARHPSCVLPSPRLLFSKALLLRSSLSRSCARVSLNLWPDRCRPLTERPQPLRPAVQPSWRPPVEGEGVAHQVLRSSVPSSKHGPCSSPRDAAATPRVLPVEQALAEAHLLVRGVLVPVGPLLRR